jgi:hypothetical protein
MKFLIVPVFVLLLIGCNQPIKSQNGFNLKEHPQKLTETLTFYTKLESETIIPTTSIKSVYTFDKNDNQLTTELYDPYNSMIGKMKYHFDENNLTKEIEATDSIGKLFIRTQFIRNEKNQIVKTIVRDSTDIREKISYFGTSDLPESGKELDKNGKIVRSWKLEYNDANLVSVTSNYYPDQTMNSQTFNLYNKNKDLIEASDKDYKGKISSKNFYKYKYDAKGNWIEMKVYDQNNELKTISTREIIYRKN